VVLDLDERAEKHKSPPAVPRRCWGALVLLLSHFRRSRIDQEALGLKGMAVSSPVCRLRRLDLLCLCRHVAEQNSASLRLVAKIVSQTTHRRFSHGRRFSLISNLFVTDSSIDESVT